MKKVNVIDLPVHFRGTNYFYASNLIQKKMSKDERKNSGQLLFSIKNRTKCVFGKENCMGKTKSKIKKKKRRLEQKAIQNGTAKKK